MCDLNDTKKKGDIMRYIYCRALRHNYVHYNDNGGLVFHIVATGSRISWHTPREDSDHIPLKDRREVRAWSS